MNQALQPRRPSAPGGGLTMKIHPAAVTVAASALSGAGQ
jgi:hypothetical protein